MKMTYSGSYFAGQKAQEKPSNPTTLTVEKENIEMKQFLMCPYSRKSAKKTKQKMLTSLVIVCDQSGSFVTRICVCI